MIQGRGDVVHVPTPGSIVEIDRGQHVTVNQHVAGMQVSVNDTVPGSVPAIADQYFVYPIPGLDE